MAAAKSANSVFRLALVQMAVGSNKAENVSRALKLIREAVDKGAKMVALPECFNSPYGTQYFKEYSEKIPGDTTGKLSEVAKELKIYLIGGTIPEEDSGKYYNTCTVYDPSGDMIAKHRKVHLFDIDIPGRIRFQESEVLAGGNSLTTFSTPLCKVGVGICYDIRFAEMAQIYANAGCKLLVYPGAFNMTTGPAHWDLLCKARALDNQVYVAVVSPARDENASYVAWGHSRVASPWSEIIAKADHKEHVILADVDLNFLTDVRKQIPIYTQKRNDLYIPPAEIQN